MGPGLVKFTVFHKNARNKPVKCYNMWKRRYLDVALKKQSDCVNLYSIDVT